MASKKQYHFVLSKEDEESGLKAHMDDMAAQKKLTARIKTALTLLAQLEQGNTEMLDSMFPKLTKKSAPPAPDTSGLEKRLDYLQSLLEKGASIPADAPMVASPPTKHSLTAGQGSTLGKGVVMSLPNFDDDDDDLDIPVPIKKSTGTNTGENFLASFIGLEH